MLYKIKHRWTRAVLFSAEITCAADAREGIKIGLAVKLARKSGADLRGADLGGAYLGDAYLRDADLRDADLRGADLGDADLGGAYLRDAYLRDAYLRDADLSGAPIIPDIHKAVYAAARQPGAFEMSCWHASCGTAHCRAGWVVTLAGEAGTALEDKIGTPAAATLIYLASDKTLERVPDFYADNETALADMRRLAGEPEAA